MPVAAASLRLCVWCGPPRVKETCTTYESVVGSTNGRQCSAASCVRSGSVRGPVPLPHNLVQSHSHTCRLNASVPELGPRASLLEPPFQTRVLFTLTSRLPQSSHQHPQYSVRRLLNRGVQGNGVITKSGATPLMVAVHANDVRLLRPCLETLHFRILSNLSIAPWVVPRAAYYKLPITLILLPTPRILTSPRP